MEDEAAEMAGVGTHGGQSWELVIGRQKKVSIASKEKTGRLGPMSQKGAA